MQNVQLKTEVDHLTREQLRLLMKRTNEMERLSRHLASVQSTTIPLDELSLWRPGRMMWNRIS